MIEAFLLATDLLYRLLLLRFQQVWVELLVLLVALVSEGARSALTHLDGLIALWLLEGVLSLFRVGQLAALVPCLTTDSLVHSRLRLR